MTNQARHIEAFEGLLREAMDRGIEDANDFVNLAVTGEELRRALVLAEGSFESAAATLSEYDALLPQLRPFVPLQLEADLQAALDALSVANPNDAQLDDFVVGVDEVLAVAAAGVRAGTLPRTAVERLGRHARDAARELAPRAHHLWQLAHERDLCLGPDPSFPGLYCWLEELAELAPERRAAMGAIQAYLRAHAEPSARLRARVEGGVLVVLSGCDIDEEDGGPLEERVRLDGPEHVLVFSDVEDERRPAREWVDAEVLAMLHWETVPLRERAQYAEAVAAFLEPRHPELSATMRDRGRNVLEHGAYVPL